MKKFLFALLLLTSFFGKSQTIDFFNYDYIISTVPHYVFYNGIRVDLEIPSSTYKSAFVIAPQLYLRKRSFNEYNINSSGYFTFMYGAGLDIQKKLIQFSTNGIYFTAESGYSYFNITFPSYVWEDQILDGNQTKVKRLQDITEQVHRLNSGVIIGVQENYEFLILDFYMGIGFKYSFTDCSNGDCSAKFNYFMTGYAYSGAYFILGFKVGVPVKRETLTEN